MSPRYSKHYCKTSVNIPPLQSISNKTLTKTAWPTIQIKTQFKVLLCNFYSLTNQNDLQYLFYTGALIELFQILRRDKKKWSCGKKIYASVGKWEISIRPSLSFFALPELRVSRESARQDYRPCSSSNPSSCLQLPNHAAFWSSTQTDTCTHTH